MQQTNGVLKQITMEQKNNENLQRLHIIAQKENLSFKEALLYLDVSKSFLYKLTSSRGINFTKPNGGKIYFRKSDLEKWMNQNESKSMKVMGDELSAYLERN